MLMNTYKDAILPIANLYASQGYITEKNISHIMFNLSIPFTETEMIFDILDKFGILISEDNGTITESNESHNVGSDTATESFLLHTSDCEKTYIIPDLLYFSASECSGSGRMIDEHCFILYKGAKISKNIYESGGSGLRKARSNYESQIENYITTEDIIFKSSTGAAEFICGYSINGKIAWKNQYGVTLKKLLSD
jgi:hypothetical protein